jgi:hypothetical protein
VRDLVGQHRGQTGVVARDRQDARVDADLAARQAEGVRLLVVDDLELPLEVRPLRRLGDAPPHPGDLLVEARVGGDARLAQDLLVRGEAELHLLPFRDEHELRAAGDRHALAGDEREHQERHDCAEHARIVAQLSGCAASPRW